MMRRSVWVAIWGGHWCSITHDLSDRHNGANYFR